MAAVTARASPFDTTRPGQVTSNVGLSGLRR
jgi:hypothetical protein